MPRIRRWHNVSHDFVRDPEVQELRRTFGDWAGYLWLELLSIADRNNGFVKGEADALARSMSFVCVVPAQEVLDHMSKSARRLSRWSPMRARKVLDWMLEKAWLVPDKCGFFVRNYATYHPTRDAKQIPRGKAIASPPSFPSFPSLPSEQNIPSESPPSPPQGVNGFDAFWTRYPKQEGYGKAQEAWNKYAKAVPLETILSGIGKWEQSQKWADGYVPMPATWLNQKRWKDSPAPAKPKEFVTAQEIWDDAKRREDTPDGGG